MSKAKKAIPKRQFYQQAGCIQDAVYVTSKKGRASKARDGILTIDKDGIPMIGVQQQDKNAYIPFVIGKGKRRGRPHKVDAGSERPILITVFAGVNGMVIKANRGKLVGQIECTDKRIAQLLYDLAVEGHALLAEPSEKEEDRRTLSDATGAKLAFRLRNLLELCFPRSPDARLTIRQSLHKRKDRIVFDDTLRFRIQRGFKRIPRHVSEHDLECHVQEDDVT
jgi:hypothetical protein